MFGISPVDVVLWCYHVYNDSLLLQDQWDRQIQGDINVAITQNAQNARAIFASVALTLTLTLGFMGLAIPTIGYATYIVGGAIAIINWLERNGVEIPWWPRIFN